MGYPIFVEQLKRAWRPAIFWGGGIGLLGFYVASVIQNAEILQQYEAILAALPLPLLAAFGVSDVSSLVSPEGFIGFGFLFYAILALAVYAVLSGLNITANDEEAGIMDVVLALPIPRWRVIAEKFAAYTVLSAVVVFISGIGLFAGASVTIIELDRMRLLEGTVNMLPTMLVIMAFTAMVASLISRKGLVATIATSFVVLSYFLFTIDNATDSSLTTALGHLSFFHYYDAEQVMQTGLALGHVALLLSLTAVCVAISLVAFERRDIA